ncbi:hypothetical protein POTOM_012167 [Populus tomentosa]|uniref:Uncharacterized protein n=1 Tax=Populus tomentosa TaxID=118781 RepID=A0A8X8A4R5_POPTO|nr:hypothetical protein POTOM_012167 [Populus tomentosa]
MLHKSEAINKSIHTYGILLSYYELFVNNHLSEYPVSLVGTASLNLFHCSFTLHSNSSRVFVTLHTEGIVISDVFPNSKSFVLDQVLLSSDFF